VLKVSLNLRVIKAWKSSYRQYLIQIQPEMMMTSNQTTPDTIMSDTVGASEPVPKFTSFKDRKLKK
jgi:hypothetical protein